MDTFDSENDGLRAQIEEVNQQNYALRAQLDALKAALNCVW